MRCSATVVGRALAWRSSGDTSPRCQRSAKVDGLCLQHAGVEARARRQRYGFIRLSERELEFIRAIPNRP